MHLSLPERFPPLFILASSVCKSLQCLIFALTQGGEGGHLFRPTCSIVLRGGMSTANKCHWRDWGVLTVSEPYWVCPRSQCVWFQGLHCSGSRLCCVGNAGPWSCALPRSKSLRFMFLDTPQRHRLGWACVLCPFQVRAAQATRCLASTLSQEDGASYHLPSPSPSVSWVRSESATAGEPSVSSGELISD